MIKDLVATAEVKDFLANELKSERNNGTYLFYGKDTSQLLSYALALAKGLLCEEVKNDFCDKCSVCSRIDKLIYSDLEIVDDPTGIKVDDVREIIQKASASPFEGKCKVFILKDIQNMKKEGSNALLKLIEEPSDGNYFIMLTNSLNILPTIKSRSIILKVSKYSPEELGVNPIVYDFFRGMSEEIKKYQELDLSLEKEASYDTIGDNLSKYLKEGDFASKVEVYKCIRDFIRNRAYLTIQDKIYFVEEMMRASGTRETYREIIDYTVYAMGKADGIEDRLLIKGTMRFPVNVKVVLMDLFLGL